MKVIEKDFIVGGSKLGTYLAYQDVEPELATPQPRDRVLPAPFFYEKRLYFFLQTQRKQEIFLWLLFVVTDYYL